ncbi:MAG: flagellar hook-length control protein FliK [Geobacteraceae bacterium]|nr:flagellar hook-length control protein FliK [Geobacteraceae bacterium]
MNTGQMMAVMQQTPASMAVPQAGESAVLDGKEGAFAGLLQGVSRHTALQAAVAGQGVALNVSRATSAPEMVSDAMTALLMAAGTGGKEATPVLADSSEVTSGSVSPDDTTTDQESQNVTLGANGAQLALLISQLHGRMPELSSVTDSRSEAPQEMSQTRHGIAVALERADLVKIGRNVPLPETATPVNTAGVENPVRSAAGTAAVATQVPVMATIAAGNGSFVHLTSGMKVATPPHNEAVVTEGDKYAAMKPTEVTRSAGATLQVSTDQAVRQPDVSFTYVRDAMKNVTESQRQPVLAVPSNAEVATEPALPAKTALHEPVGAEKNVTVMENGVPQSEQPVHQSRTASLSPTPAATRPVEIASQKNEDTADVPAVQAGTTGQQDQLQKMRPATSITPRSVSAVNAGEAKPESAPVRSDPHEVRKIQPSVQVDTTKIIAATPSGEKQPGTDENETPDRGMNGNLQQQVLPLAKTEGSLSTSSASGATQNDTSRTALPPEQIVQQVRDRLVNHETKPGSEQIVLRLSPEHLGELKVNLNLEGQRLKVEIVAENKMVRDSLMQHTDALKESLSRQNIKMDSFEVTTGGNGAGDSGRGQGQGNWRELAQQRQQNAWMPDGGYRLAKQAAPSLAAYQAKSDHMMVDLHY